MVNAMVTTDSGGETPATGNAGRRRRAVRTASLAAVVVVMAAGLVATAGVSSSSAATSSSATAAGVAALKKASTSSRGVTATTINVVFPISNLTSLASNFGFAGDAEFSQQKAAINTFVNAANAHGGINGRKIHAIIVTFDPTNEAAMRADCLQWTQGNPAVFAVVEIGRAHVLTPVTCQSRMPSSA